MGEGAEVGFLLVFLVSSWVEGMKSYYPNKRLGFTRMGGFLFGSRCVKPQPLTKDTKVHEGHLANVTLWFRSCR